MTETQATAVTKSIVVDAPPDRAFAVFTEDMGSWWPTEHHIIEAPLSHMVFEPKVGGNVYDVGTDGSECRWSRVLAYDPPNRVVFSWDISLQWQLETDPAKTSEVEVRFVPKALAAPASSSSTGTSTVTARAGRACATPSDPRAVGVSAWATSRSACRTKTNGWAARPDRRQEL